MSKKLMLFEKHYYDYYYDYYVFNAEDMKLNITGWCVATKKI